MGSNFVLRGAKEGVSRHIWTEEETGPGLRDPTLTLSLLPLQSFTVPLRTPFWIQASDQILSRLICLFC